MNFSINILKLSFPTMITLFQLVLKNIHIDTLMYKINHILKLFIDIYIFHCQETLTKICFT